MKKTDDKSKSTILRQKAEGLLKKVVNSKGLIISFAIIVPIVIIVFGLIYFQSQVNIVRERQNNEFITISKLKIDQLVQWQKERTSDVIAVSQSPLLINAVEQLLADKKNAKLKEEIGKQIALFQKEFGYADILLTTTDGEPILTAGLKTDSINSITSKKITETVELKKITWTDLYQCTDSDKIRDDIIAPIMNEKDMTIAVLVFRIDPNEYLYPLIQSFPTPSRTSEILIVRKEGDSVVFLNELRHQKNTALRFRIPLTSKNIPAVQAVTSYTGLWDGQDYRGVDVVAFIQKVPVLDWFMVTKIDKGEMYADLYREGKFIIIRFSLILLLFGAGLAFFYSYRQRNIFQELWNASAEHSATLESIGDAVISTDKQGKVQFMNTVAERLTGWTEKEAKGKMLTEVYKVIDEGTRTPINNAVEKVIQGRTISGLANHTILISKDGKEMIVSDTASPIKNKEDEIIGVVLVFEDQTEAREAQLKINVAEERFRQIAENSQEWIWEVDPDGLYTYSNGVVENLLGYTTEEIIGKKHFYNFFLPEEREELKNAVFETFKQRQPVQEFVNRNICKDGKTVTLTTSGVPIIDNHGKFLGYRGADINITERKESENALKKSAYEFRMLAEAMPQIVWVTDPIGLNIYFNQQWVDYTGLTLEESYGDGWNKPFHPDDQQMAWDAWQNATKNNATYSIECRLQCSDGTYKWWLIRGVPLLDSSGTILKWFGTCTDIDELKNSEEVLKIAKEHAEESDRLKSAFLANISHEIRTPMNGILGFAQLLKEPHLTFREQKNFIHHIEKSSDRMLNIITNIVNISKLESGQMEISISKTNVNDQIEDIYNAFKPDVEGKGIQLTVKTALSSKESIIKTDREKLKSILTNLVDNAVKFTNSGSIEIGYEKIDKNLVFTVKDTGIGIPDEKKEFIFSRFRQGSESMIRGYEGAGLGLSIAKGYLDLLGGHIWVESELGKGSTFYFTLPYIVEPEKETLTKDVSNESGVDKHIEKLKIMIAEDDESSELFLSTTLEIYSREILIAKTGIEAVELCRNNPDLDLVLMDIRMPNMDGYEATKKIRKFNKEIIIIAQTAFGLSGDRDKAMEAGCNDYISKPVDITLLKAIIRKHFKK